MTHAVTMAFTPEIVAEVLTEGHEFGRLECIEGLPEGSRLTGAWLGEYGNLILRFDHPSLPEVEEGAEPPRRNAVFHHPSPEVER